MTARLPGHPPPARHPADPGWLCVASLQGHSPQVTSLSLHQNHPPNPGGTFLTVYLH